MAAVQETIDQVKSIDVTEYKYGFVTELEVEKPAKGLTEDTVRYISARKNEPEWMLEWRLGAYRRWLTMTEPTWARVKYPKIDFNDIYYYAAPKSTKGPKSLDEVDPELLKTYEKLGIPLRERGRLAGVAMDAVFDSVSVGTTFKEALAKRGGPVSPKSEFPGSTVIGIARQVVVAETDEEAARIAKPAYLHHHSNLTYLWRLNAGDELATRQALPTTASFEDSIANGTIIAGSPATVREQLERQKTELGVNYVLTYMMFGTMSLADATRSLSLFSAEVMPKLA